MMESKKLTWLLEIKVDSSLVADGFELNEDKLKEYLIGGASYGEVEVWILSAPYESEIRRLQGYSD
jgi:hypothetical protein